MKKVSYYVDLESENLRAAITAMVEEIPCFVWEEDGAIVVEAREEDIRLVEDTFAPYV